MEIFAYKGNLPYLCRVELRKELLTDKTEWVMRKLNLTFRFFDTRDDAERFADSENVMHPYRKKHKAHVTAWESAKGERKFICWYYD